MTSLVSPIPARPRRLIVALLVSVTTLALASLASAVAGCKGDEGDETSQPGEQTIGEFCDEILPPFCTYAVQTCKQAGTVESCIAASKSICCQGACNRAARLVEGKDVSQCVRDYAGADAKLGGDAGASDAGDVSDAGLSDAGVESDSGAPGPETTQNGSSGQGISCNLVAAGFAPESCRDLAELLSAPRVSDGLHSQ